MTLRELYFRIKNPSYYMLYVYLLAKIEFENSVYTSIRDIARDTNVNTKVVVGFLNWLKTTDLAKVTSNSGCKGGTFVEFENQELTHVVKIISSTNRKQSESNCENISNVNTKSKKTNVTKTPEDISRRKDLFMSMLVPYEQQYGKDMINSFFEYWGQADMRSGKLKWEKQDTFEVAMRLSTWHRNNAKYTNSYTTIEPQPVVADESIEQFNNFLVYLGKNDLGRFKQLFSLSDFKKLKKEYSSQGIINTLLKLNEMGWQGTDIDLAFSHYGCKS